MKDRTTTNTAARTVPFETERELARLNPLCATASDRSRWLEGRLSAVKAAVA